MSAPKPPDANPFEWLRFAESDLAIALQIKDNPDILSSQIGFHAQQASEKAIKAAMLHCNIPFPKPTTLMNSLPFGKARTSLGHWNLMESRR